MKMKAVCAQTGLTDRTVRYYIEERLLSPAYTENYLGRKAFEFHENDVALLMQIATLRRFDFSIEEIRQILTEPQSANSIIEVVKTRIAETLTVDQRKMAGLSAIKEGDDYTLSTLADALSSVEDGESLLNTENTRCPSSAIGVIKGIGGFLAVWLPLLLGVGVPFVEVFACEYPVVSLWRLTLVAVLLVPPLLYLFSARVRVLRLPTVKRVLWGACFLSVLFCAVLSFGVIGECSHEWLPREQIAPATCTEDGRNLKMCRVCHCNEIEYVSRTAHNEVIDAAVAATCVQAGLTEGRHCIGCGEVTLMQESVPRLSHAYVKTVQRASCGKDGYTLLECDCGERLITEVLFSTEAHQFVKNGEKGEHGFYCTECSLEVCEYGYADGTPYGNTSSVKYYITGRIDPPKEISRELVIYGKGEMPRASTETGCHPWRMSIYLEEVRQIVICAGITSIAEGAFSEINEWDIWFGNPYANVTSFVVRGGTLLVEVGSADMSGILCGITYQYQNTDTKHVISKNEDR